MTKLGDINNETEMYNKSEVDGIISTLPTGGDMLKSENLSGLSNYATARTNLGLNTTANQTDSTDKRFMTDAQESKLDAISGTNTGDQNAEGVNYDNATSGLISTDVQGAIDELKSITDLPTGSNPIFETFIAGEQAVGLIGRYVAKGTQTLAGVKISLATLPTGASFKVDIRKNGTESVNSIFTSDTPVEILTSASATNGIYISTSTAIDNGSLVENDVLYFYITQVGSTLSGTNLEVVVY